MGFQFNADQDTGKSELGRSIQNIVSVLYFRPFPWSEPNFRAISSTRSKLSILAEGGLLYVPPGSSEVGLASSYARSCVLFTATECLETVYPSNSSKKSTKL